MTGEERTWRPRWWAAWTAIIAFHLGVGIAIFEVLTRTNSPAALSLAGVLVIGAPGLVAIDKIASK